MKRIPKGLTTILIVSLISFSSGIVAPSADALPVNQMTNLVLNTSPSVSTDQIDMFVGNEDGSIMYPTGSPQAKEIIQSLSSLTAIALGSNLSRSTSYLRSTGIVEPRITIGAGWYLYIYLNSGDINWLLGMGFTAAAAVICGALLPTGIGAVACAAIAYIVWSVIQSYAGVNKPGYCLEISLNWVVFNLHDVKWVQRSC